MNRFLLTIIILGGLALVSFSFSFIIDSEDTNYISVIPVKGAISSTGSSTPLQDGGASSTKILELLKRADENPSVKAIILEIDSPGGAVIPSKEVTEKILEIEKPVVALIRGTGASGAYWIASASDWIVADELSVVGSIGVVSSYLEFSGLLEEYGVTYQRLVTGEFKDTKTPFKELTSKEEEYLMKKLQGIHNYFVEDVAANRNMSVAKVGRLATGEFFLGQEAMELGLIDELGNMEIAEEAAKEFAGIEDAETIKYKEPAGLFNYLFNSKLAFQVGQGIGSALLSIKDQRPEINL